MKNKKAVNTLMENVVYILLILIFLAIIIFALTRAGSQATLTEQIHAKKIALIIDKAKPGMEIEIDIFELTNLARKNNYNGKIIDIDNENNLVNVKLIEGKGYNYYFFSENQVTWNLEVIRKRDQIGECSIGTDCLILKIL